MRGMVARANQVRIIAGQWRGRKLPFPDAQNLRPTSDRIRETLFNWLAPALPGSRCLDLFAGSGALGFEAASRGAASVVMNDTDPVVVRSLRSNGERLQATGVKILCAEIQDCLEHAGGEFNVVFLDPPFSRPDLLAQAVEQLTRPGRLAAGAFIYVESPAREPFEVVPADWVLHREKRAGAVAYRLYRHLPQ